MNNERSRAKTYASDAIDEMLNARHHRRADNWLISYLDVFVLVVMLMVTLISLTDNKKIASKKTEPTVAKTTTPATAPAPATTPAIKSAPTQTPVAVATPKTNNETDPKSQATEKRLQAEMEEKLKHLGLNQAVALKVSQGYAQIDIQNKVLFRSSEADLTDAGKQLLSGILPILKESEGIIIIEGHTDNRPIHTARFPTNWELSSSRATSVLLFLASQQLDPSRLHTSGFADTKPVADNTTPEGREKNRRVNIMIKVEDKLQQIDVSN